MVLPAATVPRASVNAGLVAAPPVTRARFRLACVRALLVGDANGSNVNVALFRLWLERRVPLRDVPTTYRVRRREGNRIVGGAARRGETHV
jgi:hypothetical protein